MKRASAELDSDTVAAEETLTVPHRLLVILTVAVWGATLVRSTLSNGDAATYLSQILEHEFSSRTVHLGYLLGASVWVDVLPFRPALALNLFSLAWLLVGAVALMQLEATLLNIMRPGWSVLWVLGSAPVLMAATTAEVYPAQTALLLVALAAWSRDRNLLAGLALGLSLTVSPTGLAALPLFAMRSASRRKWLELLLVAIAPFGLLLGTCQEDYLWGPRGLMNAPPGMQPMEALMFRLSGAAPALGFALPLIGGGFARALAGRWPEGRRLLLALTVHLFLVLVLLDRYRDVPAHALTVCLLGLVAAAGTRAWVDAVQSRLKRIALVSVALLLGTQALISDQTVRAVRRQEAHFADRCRSLAADHDDYREAVTGTFSERRLYEWYVSGRSPSGLTVPLGVLAVDSERTFVFLRPPRADELPAGAKAWPGPSGVWLASQSSRAPPAPPKPRTPLSPGPLPLEPSP